MKCKMAWLLLSLVPSALIWASTPNQDSDPGAVRAFLSACKSLGHYEKGNLAIVPVRCPRSRGDEEKVATLDEIITGGRLIIKETGVSGTVNELVLRNESDRFVFIMAGEILAGAKQDRILQQDVLLPPHSPEVAVAAFCVEHGRWHSKSENFYSENAAAPVAVRQQAKSSKDQAAVWREVEENNTKIEARTDTGTLAATYKSGKMAREKGKYENVFADLPLRAPQASGVIVLVNGRVMAADLFGQRRTFQALWAKLLDSYIAEAVRRQNDRVPSSIDSAAALLDLAIMTDVESDESPGAGRRLSLNSPRVKGSGIILSNAPFHLDIFPLADAATLRSPLQRQYFQNRR